MTYSPADIRPAGTLVLRSSNVKDGEVVDADNVYVDPTVVNSENVQDGDIIVVVRNGSRALIGKHAEIKGFKPNTVIGAFMTGIRSEHPSFLNALLNTPHFDKQIEMNMGATINQITGYMFSKMEFMVPSPSEQDAIGEYFKKLDNLITLHQREHDKLINVKKSMLEKMFPREGSLVPEIRFDGFTDPWTKCKLGEHAVYRRGSFPQPYGRKEWYDGEDSMPFVQVVDVTDNMRLSENTKQRISKLAQPMSVFAKRGQVLVTLQGSIGRVAVAQYDTYVDRTVLIFEKYKKETDTDFWSYVIKQKFIEEARSAPGGTIKTITKEALSDFDLFIPDLKEQILIGRYFKKMDEYISLYTYKLDSLHRIKTAMLERMFV